MAGVERQIMARAPRSHESQLVWLGTGDAAAMARSST